MSSASAGVSPDSVSDSRHVYPLTLHHNGRSGGPCILYAETAHTRAEWKNKLEEALGLRKIVQESNKVFDIEYLSRDTFLMPSLALNNAGQTWTQDNTFTGKVTCSVPFSKQFTTFPTHLSMLIEYRYARWSRSCCHWLFRRSLDWFSA